MQVLRWAWFTCFKTMTVVLHFAQRPTSQVGHLLGSKRTQIRPSRVAWTQCYLLPGLKWRYIRSQQLRAGHVCQNLWELSAKNEDTVNLQACLIVWQLQWENSVWWLSIQVLSLYPSPLLRYLGWKLFSGSCSLQVWTSSGFPVTWHNRSGVIVWSGQCCPIVLL